MASQDLERVALTLVADGKGILAADETIPTLARRFDSLGIKSTEQSPAHLSNLVAGQNALYCRANCNGAASVPKYTDEMELEFVRTDDPPHRRDWRDD